MKYLNLILATLVLCCTSTGCINEKPSYGIDDNDPDKQIGYIDLSGLSPQVLLDTEVSTTSPQAAAASTRAVTEASDEYRIRLINSSNTVLLDTSYGELKSSFSNEPLQNLMALPVDTYRLVVCSHEEADIPAAEWETPVYGTTAEFSVLRTHTADNPLQLNGKVICKLINIKVTVSISADLAASFSDDTRSTVSLNDATMVFSKDEDRAAYFQPQNSDEEGDTLEFRLSGTKDGKPAELTKTITGVKAGQWRKITISVIYSETGEIEIGVTVNNFVQDEEIEINGTESLWEPVIDDVTDLPELIWPGHELSDGMELNDAMFNAMGDFIGSAPVLNLSTKNGLQSARVSLTTTNQDFRSDIIEQAGLTDVELCSELSRLHVFRNLQLTAGTVDNTLDLSSIMWIFYKYSGTHTLGFRITDSKGNETTASLVFTYTGGVTAEDPSIVCQQFDIDQPQVVTPGMGIDILINSSTGITAFVVTIISDTLNDETLAAVNLKTSFDLCNITDPAELEALTSEDIGFMVNEDIRGKTELTFSITKFVDMLSMFPGTHKFRLAVTNENGSTTTKTLELIVEGA